METIIPIVELRLRGTASLVAQEMAVLLAAPEEEQVVAPDWANERRISEWEYHINCTQAKHPVSGKS